MHAYRLTMLLCMHKGYLCYYACIKVSYVIMHAEMLAMMRLQILKILLITYMNIYLSHFYLDQHDLI